MPKSFHCVVMPADGKAFRARIPVIDGTDLTLPVDFSQALGTNTGDYWILHTSDPLGCETCKEEDANTPQAITMEVEVVETEDHEKYYLAAQYREEDACGLLDGLCSEETPLDQFPTQDELVAIIELRG